MPASQTLLFPDPRPLVERLGEDFFRTLPKRPGVYLMKDATGLVLYVGKARSLRQRLGHYRVANPDRMGRRHLRLLRQVVRIELQECADESAALRRESELLLTLRPRFNRAGVWPGPKRFLAWRSQPAGLELAVVESVEEGWNCAGPFGSLAIHVHRALVRLLWCRLHPDAGLAAMPAGWFHGEHGARVLLPHPDVALLDEACERLSLLTNFGGEAFRQWLPPVAVPFEQPMRDEDLDLVMKHLGARMVARTTMP